MTSLGNNPIEFSQEDPIYPDLLRGVNFSLEPTHPAYNLALGLAHLAELLTFSFMFRDPYKIDSLMRVDHFYVVHRRTRDDGSNFAFFEAQEPATPSFFTAVRIGEALGSQIRRDIVEGPSFTVGDYYGDDGCSVEIKEESSDDDHKKLIKREDIKDEDGDVDLSTIKQFVPKEGKAKNTKKTK